MWLIKRIFYHKFKLILRPETEGQTRADSERITRCCVNLGYDRRRRRNAQIEVILRFKIPFIEQIIYRKIEIDPFSKVLGKSKVDNVEPRCLDSRILC